MEGGFFAVAGEALRLYVHEFPGGADTITAHGEWLRKQPKAYIRKVVKQIMNLENGGQ